jgi:hypothetical protein
MTTVDVPYAVWECGRRLEVGERWLIYAMRDDEERLTIDHCDRSHLLAPEDPDLVALPGPCRPESRMWLEVNPSEVHAGEAFTITLRAEEYNIWQVSQAFVVPESAARLGVGCPLPCQNWRGGLSMEALQPGPVRIYVATYGEDWPCDKGPPTFNWSSREAAVQLEILPPSATPPVPVDPTPTQTAAPTSQTPAPSSTPFDDGLAPRTLLYLPWGHG